MRTETPVTTDREIAEAHARAYHEAVFSVRAEGFAPNYKVWPWDDMPPENKQLLCEASLTFLTGGYATAERLSIALMAQARRMYEMGGTIGEDEHGFRAMGDKLAQLSTEARRLGVRYFGDLSLEQQSRDMAVRDMVEARKKVSSIVEALREADEAAKTPEGQAIVIRLKAVLDCE
jgi:hypothetical protein